jgi:hypothetical protein
MLLKFHRKRRIRLIALISFLMISGSMVSGQNLIGYNYKEIRNYMKEKMNDMSMSKVRNSVYSYLKYSDFAETQTILFFLTPDSLCSGVKVIFSSDMLSEKRKELDSQFKKIRNDNWIDSHGGEKYLVKLIEEKWTCTVTYEREK